MNVELRYVIILWVGFQRSYERCAIAAEIKTTFTDAYLILSYDADEIEAGSHYLLLVMLQRIMLILSSHTAEICCVN